MRKALERRFFEQPTLAVAQHLLGKFLVRRIGGKETSAMITETEAYDGFNDKASHASRGRTARNAPMFGAAGHWYVYFTYGMHWMLNVVTRKEGYPAAVLIRGILGAPGPARLTKKLRINKQLNGLPAERRSGLWVENRGYRTRNGWIYPPSRKASEGDFRFRAKIKTGPRVGVSYAGRYWSRRKLRFWIS